MREKPLDTESIIKRYLNGESRMSIALSLEVDPSTIKRRLTAAGIKQRGNKEATLLSYKQMTSEERRKKMEAAHLKNKGQGDEGRQYILDQIYGEFPQELETSVYFLKNLEGLVFYVGTTVDPYSRYKNHTQSFGKGITLHIVRNVPDSQRVIEECREIVTQSDLGFSLLNDRVPDKTQNYLRREVA